MLVVVHIVAFFGALALSAAAVAWWKVVRFPTKGPEAERQGLDSRRIETAALTSAIAFGLCAVAALLAIVRWFFG